MKIDSYSVMAAATSQYTLATSTTVQLKLQTGQNQAQMMPEQQNQLETASQTPEKTNNGNAYGKANGNNGNAYGKANGNNGNAYGNVNGNNGNAYGNAKNAAEISDVAKKRFEDMQAENAKVKPSSVSSVNKTDLPSTEVEMKARILEMLLSFIDGKDHKINTEAMTQRLKSLREQAGLVNQGSQSPSSSYDPRYEGSGQVVQMSNGSIARASYTATTEVYEKQSMTFAAQGVIKTADGKEIAFETSLSMSSEYYSKSTVKGEATVFVDPLVINYGGTAASLTSTKYDFDLDADGKMDNISFAGPGSGFLALDKDGDGKINDGSELFGAKSGNGFADLAAYDGDGNGWIDESDEVYSQLRIWSKDADGNDQLFTLKDLDIGAIFLGNVKSEFGMRDESTYKVNGQIRSTGIYLKDSGGVGTIQHIDIAV